MNQQLNLRPFAAGNRVVGLLAIILKLEQINISLL